MGDVGAERGGACARGLGGDAPAVGWIFGRVGFVEPRRQPPLRAGARPCLRRLHGPTVRVVNATPPAADHPVTAFFDMDRTLVPFNSGLSYVRYERRHGRVGHLAVARASLWMVGYHLGVIDMEAAFRHALDLYRGVPADELARRTRAWFAEAVAPKLSGGAREGLAWHRAQGHEVVLLTSSSGYAARAAADAWGLDGWIANRFCQDAEGLLDGSWESPLCYGEGKIVHAERWAAARGASLDSAWFYSDSVSDLPMLSRVAHPRVVNPDPRLRRAARRRGWEVLRWA